MSETDFKVRRKTVHTPSGDLEMRRFPNAKTAMYITPFLEDYRPPELDNIRRIKQDLENKGFQVEVKRSPELSEDELEEMRKKWNKAHKKDDSEFVPPRRVVTLRVSSPSIDVGRDFVRVVLNDIHPCAIFTHWDGSELTMGAGVYRKDLVHQGQYDMIPFDVIDTFVVNCESSSDFSKLSKRLYLKGWLENINELAKIRETGTKIIQKSMGLGDDDEEEIDLS